MGIREKRLSQSMTQDSLAERMGVSRSTVAMWESGRAMPRADKFKKLAEILECGVADLFT